MPVKPVRVILDTNVVVRGIGNHLSPSGRVLELCDQRMIVPLVSRAVIREYREILNDPQVIQHYPQVNPRMVESHLKRLAYLADMIRQVNIRFPFPRDPKDAKFIELAIAGNAGIIITCDRDILSLPEGADDVSRRFRRRLPVIQVLRPDIFLQWIMRPLAN